MLKYQPHFGKTLKDFLTLYIQKQEDLYQDCCKVFFGLLLKRVKNGKVNENIEFSKLLKVVEFFVSK